MAVIHKYVLPLTDESKIRMATHGKVLCVQVQNGNLMIWVNITGSNEISYRTFRVIGTDNHYEYSHNWDYIGTVQLNGFVWNVFEDRGPIK